MANDEQRDETIEEVTLEVETTLGQLTRAEINQQIATAKAFPRSISQFRKRALNMATFNEDIAASCAYALPRRERDKITQQWVNKTLEGPSVRLAEICVSAFGNTRCAARVVDNDGRTITAQGICHDLETNTVIAMEVKRRITDSQGRTFSDDMQVVTGNAACAIAFRNAVFKIIPGALVADIYDAAKLVAIGTAETLIKRREKAVKYFTDNGITEQQICDILLIKEISDIDLDKLGILSGMRAAARNGESTLAELFTPKEKDPAKTEEGKAKGAAATAATTNAIKKATTKAPVKKQPK